ncbi:MAG: DUF1800 family protein [Bacteroidia bacterium]
MTNWQHVQHLYTRAGFGPNLKNWRKDQNTQISQIVDRLFADSKAIVPLSVGKLPAIANSNMGMQGLSDEEKKMLKKQGRQSQKELNTAWINRMATSEAQLREKMTLFWHDHFASRLPLQYFIMQQQNNVIRKYALGSFGDLLKAVSKDAAMLRYLNNQQNRKDSPNENFAREVMELFTLGRGHYSEQDIKEAARAFTGWSSKLNGEFVYRKNWHDQGKKSVLGQTGNFDGDDVLDILLAQEQTARYITRKIYQYFVNPKVDEAILTKWSATFYESDYDIAALMRMIFSSDHFYASQNVGIRIKSPIEYIVSLMRRLKLSFPDQDAPIFMQKAMGQVLFSPPNVAGWPDGRAWIDSSSIMLRMQIPRAVIFSAELAMKAKSDFAGNEDSIKLNDKKMVRKLKGEIDWDSLEKAFTEGRAPKGNDLQTYLWAKVPSKLQTEDITAFAQGQSKEQAFKLYVMRLLCTPEFQLC